MEKGGDRYLRDHLACICAPGVLLVPEQMPLVVGESWEVCWNSASEPL
jgi:hypothetical protein